MMRFPNTFFGIKLRYIALILALLIIILVAAGYFSIQAGQKATLDSLTQQGRALTTVLIAAASNSIEADRQITGLAIDKIVTEIGAAAADPADANNDDFLEDIIAQLGLVRAAILDNAKIEIMKKDAANRSMTEPMDSLQKVFIDNAEITEPFDIIYDFYRIENRRFLFALLPYENDLNVLIISPWTVGRYANRSLSLGYLLNQLSREAGIEYIMLQNLDGIVFASKQISQTERIEDDKFLVSALDADSALSRLIKFEDRDILEIVQTFNSGGDFYGLFRVGLSLYGYRQLTANFKKQVWLFLVLLVILGLVGFAVMVGYQNLSLSEEALRRARASFQSLHNSIAGIVISADEKLQIVSANDAARKAFGLPENRSGSLLYNEYFPDDPFLAKSVLRERRPQNFETQIKIGGKPTELLVSTNIIAGQNGEPEGVIIVAHDISEKRSLEKHAQQSHRLAELGTVAAGLAHDIRNPLNAIGMIIQRLGSEINIESGKAEFDEFLAILKSEHEKLNLIIEKILQVARSSRLEMKLQNVKPIIDDVISLYKYEASEKNVELSTAVEDGHALISEESFKSIISNLLKNAIEAISGNGSIELSAKFEHDNLVVQVKDSGPGIADDQKRNLFKPFYTTKPGGTGLGLATAYKAAVDHGGDLRVESRIGGPTVFTLTIPVKG